MPFQIIQNAKNCFAVRDISKPSHIFSKKCQTKKQAKKQEIAIILSESRKSGKPVSSYFVK